MTLTIALTQEEEAQLQVVASVRGVKPEEHAHDLLANLLRSVPVQEPTQRTDKEEREKLIAAVKAGDREAWVKLLHMTPAGPTVNPEIRELPPTMPREALSREFIYED